MPVPTKTPVDPTSLTLTLTRAHTNLVRASRELVDVFDVFALAFFSLPPYLSAFTLTKFGFFYKTCFMFNIPPKKPNKLDQSHELHATGQIFETGCGELPNSKVPSHDFLATSCTHSAKSGTPLHDPNVNELVTVDVLVDVKVDSRVDVALEVLLAVGDVVTVDVALADALVVGELFPVVVGDVVGDELTVNDCEDVAVVVWVARAVDSCVVVADDVADDVPVVLRVRWSEVVAVELADSVGVVDAVVDSELVAVVTVTEAELVCVPVSVVLMVEDSVLTAVDDTVLVAVAELVRLAVVVRVVVALSVAVAVFVVAAVDVPVVVAVVLCEEDAVRLAVFVCVLAADVLAVVDKVDDSVAD